MKFIRSALVALLALVPAVAGAQSVGQLGAGLVWGNSTAARAPAAPSTITALIDRAISGTQGALLTRNGSAWIGLAPGTAGLPLVSAGAGANLAYGQLATAGIADNAVTLAKLATQATNTVLGNATSGTAVPTALAVSSCSTAESALRWTTNTGFGCNTSITAAAVPASGLTGSTLAAGVTASSLTSVGTLTGGTLNTGVTINAANVTWSGVIPGVSVATVANASGSPSATFGVMKCDGTTVTCSSGVVTAIGGVATSVQVGTTPVTSGTTTRVLYDNAGVLGEYVVSGSGSVCMTTSCSMTTPALGTPSAVVLTSGTGLPISTGVSGLGTGVATALAVNGGSAGAVAVVIATGTKALATGAISSATCTTAQTDTATGAATTDVADVTFASDPTAVTGYSPATTGMLTIIVWVTSNTLNIKVCNNTGASITPGAISLNWRVRR